MRKLTLSTVLVVFALAGCGVESPDDSVDTAAGAIAATQLRYRQVDITAGPANLDGWFPRGLTNDGEVIGQGFDCNDDFSVCAQHVLKRQRNGQFTVLERNFLIDDVSNSGDSGGCTFDPVTFLGQAGIVHANGKLDLIPPQPGEMSSCVSKVSDSGVAFVTSTDPNFVNSVYVFDHGKKRPFPVQNVTVEDINDNAQIAGIMGEGPGNRAYRFEARTQTTTVLEPVRRDPFSWGLGINRQGEVLGLSFDFGGIQRIGKWNRKNEFEISLVGGVPSFPTTANSVIWNEPGLIVASATSDGNTYLIPSPGVRLNLADLVKNGSTPSSLQAQAVNQHADIVAVNLADGSAILFQRE